MGTIKESQDRRVGEASVKYLKKYNYSKVIYKYFRSYDTVL